MFGNVQILFCLNVEKRCRLIENLLFSLLELLEAPSGPAELEAVRKAKILYRSCMNESELWRRLCTCLHDTSSSFS